jgi:hypothetical protein
MYSVQNQDFSASALLLNCLQMGRLSHYVCMVVLCAAEHTIHFTCRSTRSKRGIRKSRLIEAPGKSDSELLKHVSDLKNHFVC